MSSTFVNSLRARAETIELGPADASDRIAFRVQVQEMWDVVRLTAPASEPVSSAKDAALKALYPDHAYDEDYVMKLNGFEVLDEHASLADTGVVNGSTLLLAHRRRRPVRSGASPLTN